MVQKTIKTDEYKTKLIHKDDLDEFWSMLIQQKQVGFYKLFNDIFENSQIDELKTIVEDIFDKLDGVIDTNNGYISVYDDHL